MVIRLKTAFVAIGDLMSFNMRNMKNMKDVNIPVCLRYNEMYDVKWTRKEIDESGATMIICHHENDMEPYINHYGDKIKFIHISLSKITFTIKIPITFTFKASMIYIVY